MLKTIALLAFSAAAFAQPTVTAVVNAESFGTQLCPGLVAVVYGSNFGTSVAAVSVNVGTLPAYVGVVTAGQINVILPFAAPTGATTLTVTVGGVPSAAFPITLSAVSPYFLTAGGSGAGLAAVYETTSGSVVTAAAPAHNGDSLVAYAVGLGPTNPATSTTATGLTPATAPTATLPTVTVGGVAAVVSFAGVAKGAISGIYQVNFTVPTDVQGTVPLVISIDGVSSSSVALSSSGPVTLPVAGGSATPTVTGVQNAASYGTQLCPGLQAIVYGSGFGTNAAGVSVSVGGKAAYVIGSPTPNQMLVEIPFEAATGGTTMTVTAGGVASAPFNITLSAVSPYFITQNSSGSGPAKVLETASNALATLTAPAHVGDLVYAYAVGLGPTNPPTATGVPAASNPVANLPTVTVGGVAAKVTSAVLTQSYPGIYQVNFTVPAGVQGTAPLEISTGGVTSSATVTLPLAGLSYVINNGSFLSPGTASPGSIATVFANSLGATKDETSGLFPSTSSEGVQVTFNGTAAPMYHLIASATPQQIDLVLPTNLPTSGTVNVQLTTPTALYPNYSLTMVPSNPGFYRIQDPNVPTRFNVIAQFANSAWIALPVSTTAALGLPACGSGISPLSECGQPATIGDTLELYATGLGLATPGGNPNGTPLATGAIPPVDGSVLYQTPTTPVVTIGGIPANVIYSGLAPGYPGLYQVDITVPSGIASGDDVPVVLTILGASDSSTTISIQPRASN
ncbi:MAG: IPT/TIG domain-containing protein [Bryobacteraceae bacterium]